MKKFLIKNIGVISMLLLENYHAICFVVIWKIVKGTFLLSPQVMEK